MKEGRKKDLPSGIGEEVGGLFLGGRRGENGSGRELRPEVNSGLVPYRVWN